MTDLVNLSNLRDMTEGDKALEHVLFQEFFKSSETLIEQLNTALTENNSELWRKSAHALKGAAYNLGAKTLGDYCREAQETHTHPLEHKKRLFDSISDCYCKVKQRLQSEVA